MKRNLFQAVIFLLVLANFSVAQKTIVPIVEMGHGGLLGGVQNGKWLTPAQVGKIAEKETEYILVGWNGVEEGGVTTGKRNEVEGACPDFYRMKLELEQESGVAIGSAAKWNPMPRKPKAIDKNDAGYRKAVSDFLKTKGLARPTVKITQAYRIDLDGDGKDEVVLTATSFKNEQSDARIGDYSIILLRRIIAGKVQTLFVTGQIFRRKADLEPPTTYEVSAIADLNGDGKMEIIFNSQYYEGDAAGAFEVKGTRVVEIKAFSIYCGL